MTAARRSAREEDFAAFYTAAYPRVAAVLLRVAGNRDEAEELAQEAFARLVPRWDKVRHYDDPEAWVRTVAFRLCTSRWRRRRTQQAYAAGVGPPENAAAPDESALEVDRLLASLSLEHRAVLVLHHGLDLSVEQVARELRLPVGTVKSRLSRARVAAAHAYGGTDS